MASKIRALATQAPQLQQRRPQQEQASEPTGTNLPRTQSSSSPSSSSSPQHYSSVSSERVNLEPHPATVIKTIASGMDPFAAYLKRQAGLRNKEERERRIKETERKVKARRRKVLLQKYTGQMEVEIKILTKKLARKKIDEYNKKYGRDVRDAYVEHVGDWRKLLDTGPLTIEQIREIKRKAKMEAIKSVIDKYNLIVQDEMDREDKAIWVGGKKNRRKTRKHKKRHRRKTRKRRKRRVKRRRKTKRR